MDSNELRALADALEPMAKAPRFEDFDVPAFCAWLRACADEKPVGVYVHRPAELRYGVEWLVGDPMPNGTQLFTHPAPASPQAEQPIDLDAVAMQQMRQAAAESTWMPSGYTSNDWIADVCRWLRDGPPVAAPQAEPIDPHMIVAEDRFPDEQAEPSDDNEQAEPKREPLSEEDVLILLRSLAPDVTANLRGYIAIVRAVERHHGIGGSDAE